ncbi:hypothetical protein Tco_0408053 [Tanacetum coccineum]
MELLEKQLDKKEFQDIGSMAAFIVLETQFQMFIKSRIYLDDEYVVQEVKASDACSGEKDCSRIVSDNGNVQFLENQSNTSGDKINRSRNECNDKINSGDDTDISPSYDTEPMVEVPYTAEYNVFAVDTQHSKQPECIINTCVVDNADSNVTPDSSDMCDNEIQTNHNAVECDDKRVALANLIANLKLNIDENKAIQNQLKKVNTSLTQELKECESTLAETSRTLGESNRNVTACTKASEQTEFACIELQVVPTQTRAPQLPQTSRNTNPVFLLYRVAHRTNVSRPQPRSNQMKDKFMPSTSQVKFKKSKVEDYHRISSISNKTKSVTACNDSLKSKTLNVNVVCATCGKCVFNSNHDACVSKYLNDVNARIKKPKIVQLILFIVDSGCTKHMTGNLSLLFNFVERYMGTVSFGNDQFSLILGYGDLASDYDNSSPASQLQNVSPSADTTAPSQQELDLLFGPLYDEFFTACTSSVNKSSSPTDNSKQQDTPPITNIQSSTEPTTLTTNVNAMENNDNQTEDTQFQQDEFINPFCTPVQEIA